MTEKRRKTFRFAGFALIAVALVFIGYSAYNLIQTEVETQNSLLDAEQLVAQADAYTGNSEADPEASQQGLPAYETDEPQADGQAASEADAAQGGTETAGTATGKDPSAAQGASAASGKKGGGSGGGSGSSEDKPIVIGMLVFNSLGGRKVPVLEGVTNRDLASGAAHHPSTSPPGGVGNCVIFGHRNTVFRGFGKLKQGDTILFKTAEKTYKYAITSMAVVDPDDSRIFKDYGEAVMTLVTCYPFNYVGPAPQRYIIVAVLQ